MNLSPPRAVLFDFGKTTCSLESDDWFIGSQYSHAPEVTTCLGYDRSIDIWSWAVAAILLLGFDWDGREKNKPLTTEDHAEAINFLETLGHSRPLWMPVCRIMQGALSWDRDDRPSATEALEPQHWEAVRKASAPTSETESEDEGTSLWKQEETFVGSDEGSEGGREPQSIGTQYTAQEPSSYGSFLGGVDKDDAGYQEEADDTKTQVEESGTEEEAEGEPESDNDTEEKTEEDEGQEERIVAAPPPKKRLRME